MGETESEKRQKRGREQNEEKKGEIERSEGETVRVEEWEKRGRDRVIRDGESRMREERDRRDRGREGDRVKGEIEEERETE